jgi:rare lipoprotein A
MNPDAMTAAHKSLPFGTQVRVTDQNSGNSIVVTINDRGPFIKGRIIDLSRAAAGQLGFRSKGHTKVCLTQI